MTELAAAAAYFADVYNAREDLVAEQRGWTLTIVLAAEDTGEAVALEIDNGRIAGIASSTAPADVVVTSDSETLRDILELRRNPNEPYIFGELTVRGPEADFLRLDYVTTMLCPT